MVTALSLAVACSVLTVQEPKAASLETTARKFQSLAIQGDIASLSKLCTSSVDCQEYRYVFPGDYSREDKELFGVDVREDWDTGHYKLIQHAIEPKKLSQLGKKLLLALCSEIKDSSKLPSYVTVSDSEEANIQIPISGCGLCGKIASNCQWRVDFRRENGKWLAYRLIIGVH